MRVAVYTGPHSAAPLECVGLPLGYALLDEKQIRAGIRALAAVLREFPGE